MHCRLLIEVISWQYSIITIYFEKMATRTLQRLNFSTLRRTVSYENQPMEQYKVKHDSKPEPNTLIQHDNQPI